MKKTPLHLAILAGLFLSTDLYAQSYTVTPLDFIATDLNNSGQVVGNKNNGYGYYHATLYTIGTDTYTDLGTLGSYSYARGINDFGQITGWATDSLNGYDVVMLYSSTGGGNTMLSNPSTDYAQGLAINDSGVVAGWGTEGAALYNLSGGGQVNLGSLGDVSIPGSVARDINNNGQAVGYGRTETGVTRAALFDRSLGININLGTLDGGGESQAIAINNAGQIVGWALDSKAVSHAVIFNPGFGVEEIGFLGGNGGAAYSNNKVGQIVGTAKTAGGQDRAFLYQDGTMTDISSLTSGWILTSASKINDWGQILAEGQYSWDQRLLTPTSPLTTVSVGVQAVKLVGGMGYSQVAPFTNSTGNHTEVRFLEGIAGKNREIDLLSLPVVDGLASEAVKLDITTPDDATTHDTFVLQLSYTEAVAKALGNEEDTYLAWFDLSDNTWKNAVLGNSDDGISAHFVNGAFDVSQDYHLGYYGVDTVNNVVWAVIDHNSIFGAASTDIQPDAPKFIPEPSTWVMVGAGVGLLLIYRRFIQRTPSRA